MEPRELHLTLSVALPDEQDNYCSALVDVFEILSQLLTKCGSSIRVSGTQSIKQYDTVPESAVYRSKRRIVL